MSDYEPTEVESTDLEQRDIRALTECMTALPEGGSVYTVIGESGGGEYRVDAQTGRCTCPDAQYNLTDSEQCKHVVRVEYATGQRTIPTWADRDAIDGQLGEHVEAGPVFGPKPDRSQAVATDGGSEIIEAGDEGVILPDDSDDIKTDEDSPTYTYHWESPKQGGERYVRCEDCGAECIPADPDRLLHCEDCPHSEH